MIHVLFVLALGFMLGGVLVWGFKKLPREEWQILAAMPRKKVDDRHWAGVNFTYYGAIFATSLAFAAAIFMVLMGSVGGGLADIALASAIVLSGALPAARLVARLVEGKKYTFTVSGASFAGFLLTPLAVMTVNAIHAPGAESLSLLPTMAAISIAYILGEGVGRLACLSFGCCYGKPIDELPRIQRALFRRFCLTFHGDTKKASYAHNLNGRQLAPIQVITSALFMTCGLVGMLLFLQGRFAWAFGLTLIFAQTWRLYSETLRADHLGGALVISAYQVLGLIAIAIAVGLIMFGPSVAPAQVNLFHGLELLWQPIVILPLQALWLGVFLYSGVSMVTGSTVSFHLHKDRI